MEWISGQENIRIRGKALKNGLLELPGEMKKWPGISGRKNFFTAEGSCLTEVFIRKAEK